MSGDTQFIKRTGGPRPGFEIFPLNLNVAQVAPLQIAAQGDAFFLQDNVSESAFVFVSFDPNSVGSALLMSIGTFVKFCVGFQQLYLTWPMQTTTGQVALVVFPAGVIDQMQFVNTV